MEKTRNIDTYLTWTSAYLNKEGRTARKKNLKNVINEKANLLKEKIKILHSLPTNDMLIFLAITEIIEINNDIQFFAGWIEKVNNIPDWVDLPEPTKN